MEKGKQNKLKGGKTNIELYVQLGIIILLAVVIAFNTGKIYSSSGSGLATGIGIVSASEIIPKGVPAVYGTELGVSYDDVLPDNPRLADATITKLAQSEDLDLTTEQMARYIKIGSAISCEYCCGAQAIIFSNGERACGCAHSYAMRGLAKYLLINHPEMSDLDILNELGKWKVLFFPGIHEEKAQALEANGVDSTNYINLASNLYRGIENGQGSSGEMVGGC
ncbi:hypothetical protein AUJ84_01145 [Candidatus Pacearchaeota archaeon CG1_02_32_132]|nr:MAG: hypothetical protein AUJ84_01145 [Candidatus Pacearchaeota archaeon CG1_02_32_132]